MDSEPIDQERLRREIKYFASRYSYFIPGHEVNRVIILSAKGEITNNTFVQGRILLKDLGVREVDRREVRFRCDAYTLPGTPDREDEDSLPF